MRALIVFLVCIVCAVPALATISSETMSVSYSCNGSTTTYAYPFKVYEDNDLIVLKKDAAGTETTLVLNSDYTVTGAGTASGNVVLTAGSKCGSGYTLWIIREVDYTQAADYVEGDAFPAESHEGALDKLTMLARQLERKADRAIKLPLTEAAADQTLPGAANRANKVIGFNADGTLTMQAVTGGECSTILGQANVWTKPQTFSPDTTTAPFVIGVNGQGQEVAGLKAATAATATTATTATYWASASGKKFILFESTCPAGWTQITTQNDKALRIVSGAGGGSGGTRALSSSTTGDHTLTAAQMPSHTHPVGYLTNSISGGAGGG